MTTIPALGIHTLFHIPMNKHEFVQEFPPCHAIVINKATKEFLMSWLNYILVLVSIVAIMYSYSVGSTFGIVIWVVVFILNLALIIVERLKRRAFVVEKETPEQKPDK